MTRFASYIGNAGPLSRLLPVVHTSDVYTLRSVLEDPTIHPQMCDVYHEELSFFFYGKPAYRAHPNEAATSLNAFYLVSFIVEFSKSDCAPQRIMPFDSGAMGKGIFRDAMHPHMQVRDFELPGSIDVASRVVSQFFGDNRNYYRGQALEGLKVPPLELEADAYYALISSRVKSASDDRRACIEVQLNGRFALTRENLRAIVLPGVLLDDGVVQKFLNDMDAEAIPYTCHHAKPVEDVRTIMDKTEAYLERRGYFA
jgi:hypothetical protein